MATTPGYSQETVVQTVPILLNHINLNMTSLCLIESQKSPEMAECYFLLRDIVESSKAG